MASYAIEFWYSERGTPNSFRLLGAVPEGQDGDGNPAATPLVYSHTPLTPGQRWYYQTRRVFYPDGIGEPQYSEFSTVREAIAPYPAVRKGKVMDAIFGTSTVMGFGIQPFTEPHDKPRKVKWLVENPSGRVRAELATFASRALKNTTARRIKTGAGRATFPFSIPIEGTPNGTLSAVLACLFGQPTTTRVGGTEVELTANAAQAATALTVSALAAAIPSGSVLDFTVERTITLNGAAAAGATSITVDATPTAIPNNTPLNASGVWFRTAATASQGATALTVTALPAALADNATATYTQHRYVTTAAPAAASATSITTVALAQALTSGDEALYGAKYKHVWKNTKRYNVGTFAQLVGDDVEVSPGALINQFEMAVDYEMDTFVTPTVQGNALNQLRKYTMAEAGLDVAATDNLNPFSMIDAKFVIDGADSEDAKSVTVTVNRNARPKGVLRRKRGVARQTPSITDISFTVDLFYTSDEFQQKYFGHATEQTDHYGATCKVVGMPVSLEFATCPIQEGDLPYEFGVKFYDAVVDTDDPNIGGPEEIMEQVTLVPRWYSAENSDAEIYLVNDETLADIMTPAAPITPVPENHVTSYVVA